MAKKQLRTSIFQNSKTGIYQLRYKAIGDVGYSQISLKTTDKDEAEQKRQDFVNNHVSDRRDQIALLEAQIARLKGEEAENDLSIDRIWTTFMESTKRRPIRNETLDSYITYWNGEDGLKSFMAKKGVKSLTGFNEDLAGKYVAYMAERRLSKATAGKYITFFKKLWSVVAASSENPWINQHAQGAGGKIGKKPFTLDHQRAIINYTEGEFRLLHTILAYTGLRMVDACQLTIEEVDFDRGVIELMPKKTKFRGDNPMYAKIGIHPTLTMELRGLMKGRSSGFFLPYIASEYDRDRSSISKRIGKQIHGATDLTCAVKPPGRSRAVAVYGAHSHRKALSDRMREAGVDVMVRMQVLGHKDSRSETQDYSHVSDQEVRDAISKSMPDLLAKTQIMEIAG